MGSKSLQVNRDTTIVDSQCVHVISCAQEKSTNDMDLS